MKHIRRDMLPTTYKLGSRLLKGGFVFTLLLLLGLSSCFKEKPLAPPSNQNIGQTKIIEMGSEYTGQFFYSLESNTVISSNSRFAYDLMFDAGIDKFNVWLNTAKFMSLVRTEKTDLRQVSISDTSGKNWHYEFGAYVADSNAFGEWWAAPSNQPVSLGKVYIINLGKDALGVPIGMMKMKMNDFSGSSYSISYASVNDTIFTTSIVQKDFTRNYMYFNLTSKEVVSGIEPPKTDWDLCFTKYSVVFYDPYYLPYEVTGVLHNPSKVSAYMDSTVLFDSIQIDDFEVSRLESKRDAIGYQWKSIDDFNGTGTYSMNYHYVYFIKGGEDQYYKLHFLDFYRTGVKGYPTFEYYQL